jgi:hypothetical protein
MLVAALAVQVKRASDAGMPPWVVVARYLIKKGLIFVSPYGNHLT